MFYVLHVGGARSWVVSLEGYKKSDDARAAIHWQEQGGENRAEFRVCIYDRKRRAFVSRPEDQLPEPPGALVPHALCGWWPDRGPYTEEAFTAFCRRLAYDPDAESAD